MQHKRLGVDVNQRFFGGKALITGSGSLYTQRSGVHTPHQVFCTEETDVDQKEN